MSENLQPSESNKSVAAPPKESSSWMMFWLILTLLAAFGVVGAYLEKRLESLENKVITQTETVSNLAMAELRNSQREILNNRAETAAFAKTISTTMEDVSAMLNDSVQAFSKQTQQLAMAIDQKEKSQSELLKTKLETLGIMTQEQSADIQTAIETLAGEMSSTRNMIKETKQYSEQLDLQLASLSQKIGAMDENMRAGFISLTEITQEQQSAMLAHVSQKSESIHGKLQALRDASSQSLQDVEQKIAAIGEQAIQNAASQDAQASHVAGKTQNLVNSVSGLNERVSALSDKFETGLAAQSEKTELIHADLAEILYDLDNRSEDLLIEMAATKKELSYSQAQTKDQVKKDLQELAQSVEAANHGMELEQLTKRFDGLSNGLGQIETQLVSQLGQLAKSIEDANDPIGSNTDALVAELQTITDKVGRLPQAVIEGIGEAQGVVKQLRETQNPDEAAQSLDTILQGLAQSIQSAQTEVESIQSMIASLAKKLAQNAPEIKSLSQTTIEEALVNDSYQPSEGAVVSTKVYLEEEAKN